MQDVVEMRNTKWVHKEFKNVAKTKDDIRKEAEAANSPKPRGECGVEFKQVIGRDYVKVAPMTPVSPKKVRKKVYMCKYLSRGGFCTKGADCKFAHAPSELAGYKSTLCKVFTDTGSCKHGQGCAFAHGAHELRPDYDESSQCAIDSSSSDASADAKPAQATEQDKPLASSRASPPLRSPKKEQSSWESLVALNAKDMTSYSSVSLLVSSLAKTNGREKPLASRGAVPPWRSREKERAFCESPVAESAN
jgi:hypothetical protein